MKNHWLPVVCLFVFPLQIFAQNMKPEDTEVYQEVKKVEESNRFFAKAPSDAIVLFDGKNLDHWHSEKGVQFPAKWFVQNGILTVNKKEGGIITKEKFADYQLHIEWNIPENISGEGQDRGNSGIFLGCIDGKDEGYEIQILEGFQNQTYANGQVGSVYKQGIPLSNPSRKPGEWQTYDIAWKAPRFDEKGGLLEPAKVTVFHNGILVQNNFVLKGKTLYEGKPFYSPHSELPIKLQAHGDPSEPISFRNIWLRRLD